MRTLLFVLAIAAGTLLALLLVGSVALHLVVRAHLRKIKAGTPKNSKDGKR